MKNFFKKWLVWWLLVSIPFYILLKEAIILETTISWTLAAIATGFIMEILFVITTVDILGNK